MVSGSLRGPMNTNQIGNLAEAKIIARAMERGYGVSLPFGDWRYDLIFDIEGKLLRVQVKTGKLREGVVVFPCCSFDASKGRRSYTAEEIDVFAVYCAGLDKCDMGTLEMTAATETSRRVTATRNNQKQGIKFATDFEF